jgi:DNA repair photolyase
MTKKITSGTKEWADYNINCIKGCANNCRYCYAKIMAKRFGRATEETWKDMIIRESMVQKNYRKYKGRVMFPSSHDIVEDSEVKEACLTVLEKLVQANNQVLVTTKPFYSVTNEITSKYVEKKDNIQFRFTITSNNNEILSFWERNAPLYEERLRSLILASERGYKTSVSIEPFLDKNPVPLIDELTPYVTESIWIGPMNHMPRKNIQAQDIPEYERIREIKRYENLVKIYKALKDRPLIRFKDSMLIKLGLSVEEKC